MYAPQRSKVTALHTGSTEGKYFYRRPDTEDPEGRNSDATLGERAQLNVLDGYTQQESGIKRSPGEA